MYGNKKFKPKYMYCNLFNATYYIKQHHYFTILRNLSIDDVNDAIWCDEVLLNQIKL